MKDSDKTDFLFGANAVFIEELYQQYLKSPSSVDSSWHQYFATIQGQSKSEASWGIKTKIILPPEQKAKPPSVTESNSDQSYFKAKFLIEAYRERGHFFTTLDPLGLEKPIDQSSLKLAAEDVGLGEDTINLRGEYFGLNECTTQELLQILRRSYAQNIGVEFSHVTSLDERNWLYEQIENHATNRNITKEEQIEFLQHLVEIEGLEQYLHVKFPGAKRFSIEGGDTSIVALIKAIEFAASKNISDVVIGMAHRGRLSTLAKVLGKPYRAILAEFMGTYAFPPELNVSGDVKYHMGYSSDKTTKNNNKIHLSLCPNPSHLEAVNPVVAGKARAEQDAIKDTSRDQVMGILIHGDAAFAGQGVVAESIAMSGLEHYNIGGLFHLVINNQIGFTTNPKDSRPGRYATEVAKIIGAPIIHINGDDVEAVAFATKIASEYRYKFKKDFVLDIVCYRKYGHNEGDEPMYTQAVMYNIIKDKKTPAAVYANYLVTNNIITEGDYESRKTEFKAILDNEYEEAKSYKPKAQWLEGRWSQYQRPTNIHMPIITGCDIDKLKELGTKLCNIPSDFALNPKLTKLFEQRKNTLAAGLPIDWATGEQLAFATLLSENIPVRLSGQDAGRGTFSHRHSVLHSQIDDSCYIPLNNLSETAAKYEVVDSNLSEYAVLGFEYGYSLVNPKHLVIWEAQFGDFSNGAQIMFDQFISAAETKWLRMSGLVLLLPHGYEGQGPEHSSARLERFLQLCAEDNIQVANPTTPASLFHILRRQIHRNFRKPLVIMSPKSLLRHKFAVSMLSDLASNTSFSPMLEDPKANEMQSKAKRIVICSGKVYYDLLEMRDAQNLEVALIRIEQYYPFDESYLATILAKYKAAKEFIWCQEEPKNMGAWTFIKPFLEKTINDVIQYAGRPESASPATGYLSVHNKEQETLVKQALGAK